MANRPVVTDAFFTKGTLGIISGKFRGGVRIYGPTWKRKTYVAIGIKRGNVPANRHRFQPGNTHAQK